MWVLPHPSEPMMMFHTQDQSYPVGAQFIGAPPIYRPLEGIDGPVADKSAVRA
jgi:hypothetical protein